MSITHIADLCDRIVDRIVAIGHPIAGLFQTGLTVQEIREIGRQLPFVLPDSVVAIYEWRNGTLRSGRDSDFFPGWRFLPFAEAIERYAVLVDPVDDLWNDHWLPLFSSSDISTYGISCKDASAVDGEIVAYEYMLGDEVIFESLEAMLKTVLKAFDTGVYYLDDQGILEVGESTYDDQGRLINVDMSKFHELARQFNPGLKRYE